MLDHRVNRQVGRIFAGFGATHAIGNHVKPEIRLNPEKILVIAPDTSFIHVSGGLQN